MDFESLNVPMRDRVGEAPVPGSGVKKRDVELLKAWRQQVRDPTHARQRLK